jgi:hypothetical protein
MAFRSREKRNHFYCVIIPNPKFRSDIDEHSDEDIQKFDGSWRTGHTRRERERDDLEGTLEQHRKDIRKDWMRTGLLITDNIAS